MFDFDHLTRKYYRRPSCRGYVRFFDIDETFRDYEDKTIFEIVEKIKKWVPAKEVLDEISCTISH
jgi:hypothetical protein